MKIIQKFIPLGANRPGRKIVPTHITVHETGNSAPGTNARNHAAYLEGNEALSRMVSWHYTVDDKEVIQHLPDTEMAYHAGTTDGNRSSIGIEICINRDGDFEKAKTNAQLLVRKLMNDHAIPIEHVVQHNFWNGKDCPRRIRAEKGGWERFKEGVTSDVSEWAREAYQWAVEQGITDGTNPKSLATREQVWVMMYNMKKKGESK